MNNPPSIQAMSNLASKAEMLLLNSTSMERLLDQNREALDRVVYNVGSKPSHSAVQSDTHPQPTPQFLLSDFLDKTKRERSFAELLHKVEIIETRTALVRQSFNRATQRVNRQAYNQNIDQWAEEFSDMETVLANIKSYSAIINEIRTILLQN